jgi:DNA polymerase-3 subunit beta
MRLSTADLRDALKTVALAVSSLPYATELACVRLWTLGDGGLYLSATDYTTWISTRFGIIEGEEPIDVLVSHKLLSAIGKATKAKEVDLTLDGSAVVITAGRTAWSSPIILGELPKSPKMPEVFAKVDAAKLREALGQVVEGAATGNEIECLKAVQIKTGSGMLSLTTTDRYRMHTTRIEISDLGGMVDTTTDAKAKDLYDALGSLDGDVALSTNETLLGLDTGSTVVILRRIGQTFPQIDKLWPSDPDNLATVIAEPFLDALAAVTPAVDEKEKMAIVTFAPGGLSITAKNREGESASTEVENASYDGRPCAMAFNLTFLRDAIKSLNVDEVMIRITGPFKPAVVEAASPHTPCRMLVTPIRQPSGVGWISKTGEVTS